MFKGEINLSGRPKGSKNRITNELKVVLEELAENLYQSIDVSKLKDAERMKLFVSILPYLIPKKSEIDTTTKTDVSWLDQYTESDLEKILNS
jgi:hypothetical protein